MPERRYDIRVGVKRGDTSAVTRLEKDFKDLGAAADGFTEALNSNDVKSGERNMRRLEQSAEALRKDLIDVGESAEGAGKDIRAMDDSLGRVQKGAGAAGAEMKKGRKGTRDFGFAALQASQAFEDLQFGIRGVLNNIPGLVMSLGGTAGLAGVISVAAVALTQLGSALGGTSQKLKEIESAAALAQEQLQRMREEAEKAGREEEAERLAQALDDQLASLRTLNQITQQQLTLEEARADAAQRVAAAEREVQRARIQGSDMSPQEKAAAIAALDSEAAAEQRAGALQGIDRQVARQRAAVEQARLEVLTRDAALAQAQNALRRRAGPAEELAGQRNVVERMFQRLDDLSDVRGDKFGLIDALFRGRRVSEAMRLQARQQRLGFASVEDFESRLGAAQSGVSQAERTVSGREAALQEARRAAEAAERELRALEERRSIEAQAQGRIGAAEEELRLRGLLETSSGRLTAGVSDVAGALGPRGAGLESIVQDAIPDASQANEIVGILQVLSAEYAGRDREIFQSIQELIQLVDRTQREQAAIREQINALQATAR